MKRLFNNRPVITALVLPGLLVMVFAMIIPIGFSVYFSLTDWAGIGEYQNIGLANYLEILTADGTFYRSLLNVGLLIVITVFVQNPVAFALAAVLAHISQRASRFFRTVYFIPAVLSVVVICALWMNIMNPSFGILNKFLSLFSAEPVRQAWLAKPATAIWSVIWIITWQGFGWALLFYYSGLMTVPKELEEAAVVDGAGWLRTYANVVLPYMMPVISAVVVIDVISSMKQMEMIFLSTGGGPGDLTQFTAVYLYQKAFVASQYGYGNALSILFVIVSVGITLLVQRLFRTEGELAS
jgi:raffinose/stachyose/melibiose transport system permease protein